MPGVQFPPLNHPEWNKNARCPLCQKAQTRASLCASGPPGRGVWLGTACDRQGPPRLRTSSMNRWGTSTWRGVLGLAVTTSPGCVQGPGPSLQTLPLGQVRSKRCDVKTKFVTHIPCTPCPAIKKRVCPLGWIRAFPEKISQDCRCASPLSLASRAVLWGGRGPGGLGRPGEMRAGIHSSTCLLAPPVRQVGREKGVGGGPDAIY